MIEITEELKREILNSLKRSNFRIKSQTRKLFNKLEEYQNYLSDKNNWGKTPSKFLTDEELNFINNYVKYDLYIFYKNYYK